MKPARHVSIGIVAWNEELVIGPMLESLFNQTLFRKLGERGLTAEIVCVTNGCTDRTPDVAQRILAEQERAHPCNQTFSARVVDIRERGKITAWNLFVHWLSASEAPFLFLLDADIIIHDRETLWNLLQTLESDPAVSVAVDTPCKDIGFKRRKTLRERASLAASRLTQSSSAQLCAQLYCIRSSIARNIHLPNDLAACDDGFIKTLVCTDFLAHPTWSLRIRTARNAAHTFAPYTSLSSLLKNQKRQVIGQTMVHVLVDGYLRELPALQRAKLAETLRRKDRDEPDWLQQLVNQHVGRCRFFWQLYPGLLTHRFRRLAGLSLLDKFLCFPVALAGFAVTAAAGLAAFHHLKTGRTAFWPRADRRGFGEGVLGERAVPPLAPVEAHPR